MITPITRINRSNKEISIPKLESEFPKNRTVELPNTIKIYKKFKTENKIKIKIESNEFKVTHDLLPSLNLITPVKKEQ